MECRLGAQSIILISPVVQVGREGKPFIRVIQGITKVTSKVKSCGKLHQVAMESAGAEGRHPDRRQNDLVFYKAPSLSLFTPDESVLL